MAFHAESINESETFEHIKALKRQRFQDCAVYGALGQLGSANHASYCMGFVMCRIPGLVRALGLGPTSSKIAASSSSSAASPSSFSAAPFSSSQPAASLHGLSTVPLSADGFQIQSRLKQKCRVRIRRLLSPRRVKIVECTPMNLAWI